MRALLLFIVFFSLLPLCFTKPWIGILVFSWVSYMNPDRYAWGAAHGFQFAQLAAIATLAGYLLTKDKDRIHMEIETVIIALLWILFTLTSFTAFYPELAWPMWNKTSKVLLMAILTIPLINNKDKLRYLILTIGLSLGLLGLKGGVWVLRTGGTYNVRGPDKTFIAGEGDFALALNMILPVLFFQARNESNKWIKLALYSCFFFSIISVIFTYRRGGFVGLAVVTFLLLVKSKKRILATVVVSVALLSAPYLITAKWFDRMDTIKTYEEDGSAMGRINAWHMAWNVAVDNPWTGAGFDGLTGRTRAIYATKPGAVAGDVHSIYFEVLGEQGFIGFGIFMSLLISILYSMQMLKRKFKNIQSCSWICNYADMLQVSIIAYMTGGVFLGRAYFDLFYHLAAISVVLKVLAKKELEKITHGDLPA